MFAEQGAAWIVHMLVFFLIMVIPVIPMYGAIIAVILATEGQPDQALPALMIPLYLIICLIIFFGSAYLMGGAYRSAFKQLRGERIKLRDLFSGGDCWLRVLGAMLLVGILTTIGFLLFIIPGFIVAGMFFFTLPLIVERDLGVIEAMRASYEVTRHSLLMFTLFALVIPLLASLGGCACYVGLLVTYPLLFTITAVAYRDCFGVAGARSFSPSAPPPPPGYAPPASASLVCPNCQAEVPATALFCVRCGNRMQA
jgi:uncharacterized membrane protein